MSDSSLHLGSNSTIDPTYAHESNTGSIIGGLGFLTAVATIVVFLRFYVRIFIVKVMGADDYTSLLALVR